MSEPSRAKPAYEYNLRSVPKHALNSKQFNVMHITGASSFKWENFTPPIHMYKETPEVRRAKWQLRNQEKRALGGGSAAPSSHVPKKAETIPQETTEPSGSAGVVAPFGIQHQRKNLFRKKTIILARGSASRPPKDPEAGADKWPMILEDDDGSNSYTGRVEGNSRSNYVLFIRENDGFRVIPVDKWLRFRPKVNYQTLSLEEAEATLANQNRELDRWIMKTMRKSDETLPQPSKNGSQDGDEEVLAVDKQKGRPFWATAEKEIKEDEIGGMDYNYEEEFDDDDETLFDEETEQKVKQERVERSGLRPHKLTDAGKELRNIMKTRDPDSYYGNEADLDSAYEEDNEEAETLDIGPKKETDKKFEMVKSRSQENLNSRGAMSGAKDIKPQEIRQGPRIVPTVSNMKKERSETFLDSLTHKRQIEPTEQHLKKMRVDDVPSKAADDSVVTEEEIRQFLAKGPMKTKDLVHTFRAKLKKDSSNLHRIKEIIRKIGVVKSSTEVGEGEKIVYLKE